MKHLHLLWSYILFFTKNLSVNLGPHQLQSGQKLFSHRFLLLSFLTARRACGEAAVKKLSSIFSK